MYYCVGPGETITLGSKSKGENYEITTVEHPEDDSRGFIGVTTIKNEGKIKDKYDMFGGMFFWLKGLLKWLYLLNLFIGLMNLLPIYITDGAKKLLVMFQSSMKDKKKAIKIWSAINWLFVLLILIGLFATYLKKFGLF